MGRYMPQSVSGDFDHGGTPAPGGDHPHRPARSDRTGCRDSRPRLDRAEEVRRLSGEDYPQARRVKPVCDDLRPVGLLRFVFVFSFFRVFVVRVNFCT